MKANKIHACLAFSVASFAARKLFLVAALLPLLLNSQNLADSAQKAYEKQQFKQAIAYYERVAAAGQVSAKLYYNSGNAYFKDNQLGRAIYNYELARKLDPRDEDIKTNLKIANSRIIDKIEGKENFLAGAIKSGVYTMHTPTGWAWLSIGLVVFTLICMVAFIVSQKLLLKRIFFWLAIAGGLKFIIVLGIGFAATHELNKKSQAIVTTQVVQVLNAPNESGKAKFSLHEGTKLTVLSTNEEWTAIQLANGNEGWIRTKELGLF
jgi:tetratricopeptide (TPR) repeat protein